MEIIIEGRSTTSRKQSNLPQAPFLTEQKKEGIRGLRAGSTESRKDLEAERAREDSTLPVPSAWHEALRAMSLGGSLGLKQKPGFQPHFSVSLVMWILLDPNTPQQQCFVARQCPAALVCSQRLSVTQLYQWVLHEVFLRWTGASEIMCLEVNDHLLPSHAWTQQPGSSSYLQQTSQALWQSSW